MFNPAWRSQQFLGHVWIKDNNVLQFACPMNLKKKQNYSGLSSFIPALRIEGSFRCSSFFVDYEV